MDCGEIRRLLGPHLDGELDGELARAIEAHVGTCPACRSEREALRGLDGALEAAAIESPFGEGFAARVARRAMPLAPAGRGAPVRQTPRRAWALGIAATLAGAAFMAYVAWGPSGGPATPSGTEPVARAPGAGSRGPSGEREGGPRAPAAAPVEAPRWAESIKLEDGSRIELAEGAEFERLGGEGGLRGILRAGRLRATVPRQPEGATFSIATPEYIAEVVGTEFELVYDAEREWTGVYVFEGRVRVSARDLGQGSIDGPVVIPAGKGASFGPAARTPTPLDAGRQPPASPAAEGPSPPFEADLPHDGG